MNKIVGSTWGKWDFHVHTPYSILNNQFGFNPFDPSDKFHEKEFDEYFIQLFSKAIEQNIVAIGITDYFMIEGYKRIKEQYLDCPEKLQQCFPDELTRNKVKDIFVFPNIEFRLSTFVGKDASSVNYHVIFSDELSIQNIQDNFLNQLNFDMGKGNIRTVTLNNIINFGEALKVDKGIKGDPLKIGLDHITISDDVIIDILKKVDFRNKCIISIPVDEDLSKIPWNGRDYTTRKKLYNQAQCYMTSNDNTRKWALDENRIPEFNSIKPCIWGSDAHEYNKMFKPDGDKFCWIKALPSFEGLLQILYEPFDRVRIQKDIPYERDPHKIIANIQFEDDKFSKEPIAFNDSLSCVIGGKSTGKSLLLRNIAYSIDADYAKTQEAVVNAEKNFQKCKCTVLWKDGTTEKRKFVYIPQTYLNRTVDNPQKETSIDNIIMEVLHQNSDIREAYKKLRASISDIKGKNISNISKYEERLEQLKSIRTEILSIGTPTSFDIVIKELNEEISELAGKVNITDEDLQRYSELNLKIQKLTDSKKQLEEESDNLNNMVEPIVAFPNYIKLDNQMTFSHDFSKILSESVIKINRFIDETNLIIQDKWDSVKNDMLSQMENQIADITTNLNCINSEYSELKLKVEQTEQLKKLANQIERETANKRAAQEKANEESNLINQISNLKSEIIASHKAYHDAYFEYCSLIPNVEISQKTKLTFCAEIEWKKDSFINFIREIFDNRHFSTFYANHKYDLCNLTENNYTDSTLSDIWDAIVDISEKKELHLKSSVSRRTALERLFDDWFNVHYIVTNDNDTIDNMSPGKKALTLLELLISLNDTDCPILIDQPEDDLDNRSIYNELVRFIKEKKCKRQVIVVTHNANIVLGADAEQVIIANHNGRDSLNNDNLMFEYRSGAIEDNDIEYDSNHNPKIGILSKTGIQTQICDILEGGKTAFEKRHKKYTYNNE